MKFKVITIFILLTLLSIVSARECLELEDASSGCDILVFTINSSDHNQVFTDASCSINITGLDKLDDKYTMTNGGLGTGWHNYTFIESSAGVYPFQILCSKSSLYSREAGVITVSTSIPTEFDNLETHGDSTWSTATGFSTPTDITKVEQSILGNSTDIKGAVLTNKTAIISRGDSAWITAVGFSTHTAADVWSVVTRTLTTADWTTDSDLTTQSNLLEQSILGNSTNIITIGNTNWTSATSVNVTLSANNYLTIANYTWSTNLSKMSYTSTRWTPAWYLDKIYSFP